MKKKENTDRKNLKFKCIIGIALLILISCNSEDNEFVIGDEFIETQTRIHVIDTFTVELTTVLIDSLNTSGTGTILAGSYEDDIFGKVTCNSFFQVALPSYSGLETTDVYDSIVLILKYNGYSYGDTTKQVSLTVHMLDEELEIDDDNSLYNCSEIDYKEEVIGSCTFYPHPDTSNTVNIRIDDAIGTDLINKFLEDDIAVSSQTAFDEYFKGMAIITDAGNSGSVIGFASEENNIVLRIYTHRVGEEYEEIEYDLVLSDVDNQFNQILRDLSSSVMHELESQREVLTSEETGNNTFVQGGTGIMTRIRFPYLEEVLLFEQGVVMNVELILIPDKESYFDFDLPEYLVLYETDKDNNFNNVLYDDNGYVLLPEFILDEFYHENTSYTFNITSFIKNELSDDYFDVTHGLLLNLPTDEVLESLERLMLDPEQVKLKLYYLTY